uniref:Uncharacterized protein n=1 Tax=Romanomermis culicivorax TaxID=13658 RepID=A0A915KIH0_ROMCU
MSIVLKISKTSLKSLDDSIKLCFITDKALDTEAVSNIDSDRAKTPGGDLEDDGDKSLASDRSATFALQQTQRVNGRDKTLAMVLQNLGGPSNCLSDPPKDSKHHLMTRRSFVPDLKHSALDDDTAQFEGCIMPAATARDL